MKAMILAAGRGARLGALTAHTPKPLLKIGEHPLIAYHLINLAKIGVTDVIINISYLADKIQAALGDGRQYGVNIVYSYEPERLETGGGIYQALPLLGKGPFLVISADIWTDYPLERLLAGKLAALAHLVLVPNPNFHPEGDFTCENGVLGLTGAVKYTYANIGLYRPELFTDCTPGFFRLGDLLKENIKQRQISGEVYNGAWYNVGTIEELESLQNRKSFTP